MLDYQARYVEALARNVAEVQDMVASGRVDDALSVKVDRYCDKFGFSRAEVLELIADQPMFAATFAKDPVKQNLHESSAATYIAEMAPLVERFENLPAGGPNAVQLAADGVLSCASRDRLYWEASPSARRRLTPPVWPAAGAPPGPVRVRGASYARRVGVDPQLELKRLSVRLAVDAARVAARVPEGHPVRSAMEQEANISPITSKRDTAPVSRRTRASV